MKHTFLIDQYPVYVVAFGPDGKSVLYGVSTGKDK